MKTLDRYSSLFWFILSVAVCIQARSLGLGLFRNPGPGFLFFWSGIVLAVLSVIIFLETVRRTEGTSEEDREKAFGNVNWMKVLCVVMALVIYALILEWLGFVISTVLFLAFLLQSIEATKRVVVVLVSVGSSLLTYALFELWLHARLPKGIFGIEVLKEIKKIRPCVPAIIITAYGNEQVAVKAFRCGARDYVKKPFTNEELLKRIDFCLSLNIIEQAKNRKVLTNEPNEIAADLVSRTKAGRKHHTLQRALTFIHNNFSTDINLDRVAGTAGISKYHFSRLFKEMTGMTYQSYLNRVRIEQAKKLLNDDALSITDTGSAVGYSDLTHFERIFKKLTGITPSQFRRRTSALPSPGENIL